MSSVSLVLGRLTSSIEKPDITPDDLWQMRGDINEEIVWTLNENVLSQSVLENTLVDFDHDSMTYPTPLAEKHLVSHVVSRRVGVEQAKEKDGVEYTATRVVNHESESFKNGDVHYNEALTYDTLDRYSWVITWFLMLIFVSLLWKDDISIAFRRLPVFVDNLRFVGCVFMANSMKLFCKHLGLLFCLIASAHGWERMGE